MNSPALVLLYIVLASIVLIAVTLILLRKAEDAPSRAVRYGEPGRQSRRAGQLGRVWVVVNPTKPADLTEFQDQINSMCAELTGEPALWVETTRADPGTGQAIHALQSAPSVVIAAGGDGTVRAVAAGMSHSGVPMGIIPVGTGNLVARNLQLPLDLEEAFQIAVSGRVSGIDLAWLRTERVEEPSVLPAEGSLLTKALADVGSSRTELARLVERVPNPLPNEYAYLVISGVGFDGETMANTNPKLKKAVGWAAYVITALKSLHIERMKATITLYSPRGVPDGKPNWAKAVPEKVYRAIEDSHTIGLNPPQLSAAETGEDWISTALQARTVLLANCGMLPFTVLSPYAEIDDGALDVIAIDTQAGVLGWANLAAKVLGQGVGLRPINTPRDLGQISFQQCSSVRVDTNRAYPVQVDGDHIGSARTVIARIDEGALLIRQPWHGSA